MPPELRKVKLVDLVDRFERWDRLLDADETYVKWSEVEALLLQRAQESQEILQAVLDAIKGTIDTSTNIADHPNVKFAQMERLKLESALTARAQEIEQVKAALERTRVYIRTAMNSGGIRAIINASAWERGQREGLQHALNAINAEFAEADAALVSRAPQGKELSDADPCDGQCAPRPRGDGARVDDAANSGRDGGRGASDERPTDHVEVAALVSRAPQQEQVRVRGLCSVCGGNGVVKIPGGVSVCDHCHGDCWEPQPAAPLPASAALQALIAKWRCDAVEREETAVEAERKGLLVTASGFDADAKRTKACADELEAALSRADME